MVVSRSGVGVFGDGEVVLVGGDMTMAVDDHENESKRENYIGSEEVTLL